jgi:broad specificity phosphatase PhoE
VRELIVVRHGETEGNVAGIAQGRLPYPLTARGRAQAEAAARLIERLGWRPTHCITSPLARCVETAAVLTARLGADDARPVEAFTEIDCGAAEGMAATPTATGFEEFGGESHTALFARVGTGLDALPPDGRILLVTHGGVFKAILHHLLAFRGWLGLRCGSCMRLERRGERFAFTHFLHPEEVE